MRNFSLYELLSYLIPGYIFIKLLLLTVKWFEINLEFELTSDLDSNVMALIFSLILGLIIHRITFSLLSYKPFARAVYQSLEYFAVDNTVIESLYVKIDEQLSKSEKLRNIRFKFDENEETTYGHIFDHAYYYLETNNKDKQVKSFQSFYFLFRNLFTTGLVFSIPLILFVIVKFNTHFKNPESWILIILYFIGVVLIAKCAKWLRRKMIVKVYWSYYSELIHRK